MFRTVTPLVAALALFALHEPAGGQEKPKDAGEAVKAALRWFVRQQNINGSWSLDGGRFRERGQTNDTAATAFGLLPLLGAGHTHQAKTDGEGGSLIGAVKKGLSYLLRSQNKQNGDLGGGMYAHALATMALCRAYGLTKDASLKGAAQAAVDYIVSAQHAGGGWRYQPGEAGDTSVTSWQVQAIHLAKETGLKVPAEVFKKAIQYLDSVVTPDEGYSYLPRSRAATPAMTAAGLTCRQLLQDWDGKNERLREGVAKYLQPIEPGVRNLYLLYFTAQVMKHSGGAAGEKWLAKLQSWLVKTQQYVAIAGQDILGSWSPLGDVNAAAGGRLMITSLSLLILQCEEPKPKAGGK